MTWQLASAALLVAVLVGGAAWYERARPSARTVALVAALAALAIAGRIALAPVPNVVATTDIVLISGFALGAAPGFAVGSLAALASNFWLGQGPWTPWQMGAWGLVGIAGALLAAASGRRIGRLGLAGACGLAGLAYGAFLDLSLMVSFGGEQSLDRYLAISARGLPFNLAHAAGNVALALAAGPALVRMLTRFRDRFDFRWPAPAGEDLRAGSGGLGGAAPATRKAPAALLVVGLAASVALPVGLAGASGPTTAASGPAGVTLGAASAASIADGPTPTTVADPTAPARSPDRSDAGTAEERAQTAGVAGARAWLRRQQNGDGGFGPEPGEASSPSMTGWAAVGLEAAGVNPRDLRRGGRTPISFLRRESERIRSTGDLERTILALVGAGLDPHRFGGRDLVAELRGRRGRRGGFAAQVNLTAFGILALRAAGADRSSVRASARWLRGARNRDGGWGSRPGTPSEADSTGAALQALAAAGGGAEVLRDGARFLRRAQRPDGGFALAFGGPTNSQSTAWSVQGLVAAGTNPARVRSGGKSPFDYLATRRVGDGHYGYSSSSDQTPVWVTAQVLLALAREPFPLAAVQRRGGGGSAPGDGADRGSDSAGGDGAAGSESADNGSTGSEGRGRSGPGARSGSGAAARRRDASRQGPTTAAEPPRGELGAIDAGAEPAAAEGAGEEDGGGPGAPLLVGAGFTGLAAALAAGFLWYRRRLPRV